MKAQHVDVLIVGAGMVGSALAVALGRNNISVALFDRYPPKAFSHEQLPDIRVSALSYASEQILKQLSAWEPMQAMRMCPYRKMAVWEKLGGVLDIFPTRPNKTVFNAHDIEHEQLGFIVENRVTQLGLHQAIAQLKNVELHCPARIKKIDTIDHALELDDGRRFQGKLIVGADGANSQVRKAANLGLSQRDYEQQCLVSTVEIEGGAKDITWQAFTPTGPESFLPLPDIEGKSYGSVVWYNLPKKVKQLMELDEEEFLNEMKASFPRELPPIKVVHERSTFPLTKRHAQHYYKDGIVLVGDAAHTINPLAGQGVNLGFQDVAWLAEILVHAHQTGEHIGSPAVLFRYEKNRRPENQAMMSIMDGFYHSFSNNKKPLKLFRNIGLALAGRFTPAVKQVMKYAMGISEKQPRLARGLPLS